MRIAVIEDEYLIADDLISEIRRRGHEPVGPFAELSDALHATSREAFDAALLDINLQGQASFGIADILLGKNIPFLIYTGYSREAIPARYIPRVVEKPISIAGVVDRLPGTR